MSEEQKEQMLCHRCGEILLTKAIILKSPLFYRKPQIIVCPDCSTSFQADISIIVKGTLSEMELVKKKDGRHQNGELCDPDET